MHPLVVHLVGAEERLEAIRLQQGLGVGAGNITVEVIQLAEEVGIVNHDIILEIAIIIVLTCVTANDLVRLEADVPRVGVDRDVLVKP